MGEMSRSGELNGVAYRGDATHLSVVFNLSRFKRSNVQGPAPVFDSRGKIPESHLMNQPS